MYLELAFNMNELLASFIFYLFFFNWPIKVVLGLCWVIKYVDTIVFIKGNTVDSIILLCFRADYVTSQN